MSSKGFHLKPFWYKIYDSQQHKFFEESATIIRLQSSKKKLRISSGALSKAI